MQIAQLSFELLLEYTCNSSVSIHVVFTSTSTANEYETASRATPPTISSRIAGKSSKK